jgi:hypothetical protein
MRHGSCAEMLTCARWLLQIPASPLSIPVLFTVLFTNPACPPQGKERNERKLLEASEQFESNDRTFGLIV